MCSSCYNDPGWDKIHYQRQGAVEVEDFDDILPYRHPPRRKKRKKEKTRPGCWANDYKAHVYVWTTETEVSNFFSDYFGFSKTESRVCAGCGKCNGSRYSEEYEKIKRRRWDKLETPEKGRPVARRRFGRTKTVSYNWWQWESNDEDYMAARKAYVDKHGWPLYLYNSYY